MKFTFVFVIVVGFITAGLAQQGATAQDLKVYQNYDFVPGDKVVFEDDFKSDTDGEFPSHWSLQSGQGVVNKLDGEPMFALTEGNYARVSPRIKGDLYLGDPFTVELDFYMKSGGSEQILVFFKSGDNDGRLISFGADVHTGYFEPELTGNYPGDVESYKDKWHHAAIIYKNGQMKCYIDQYRVLVIPDVNFKPEAVRFGGIADQANPLVFKNVRIANGGGMNTLDKLLTDGKVITHAILFDVNKSTIKPSSMGAINEITKFLKAHADLKLSIEGHTDSDGDAAANTKLSQARAEAVKSVLVDSGIDASRLQTRGWGKTKPIDKNTTPEGKANNRRVELVKIK